MFAVVSYKGNQYEVAPGKEYAIDLLTDVAEDQKEIVFSDVLLIADDKKTTIGTPTVAGASVKAEILGEGREDKVRIVKFHAKKHYQRTGGQREGFTRIKVLEINQNEK